MSKVKVTVAEGRALKDFLSFKQVGLYLEQRINFYIDESKSWSTNLVPLREMGFDKFVAALVNGYEIEKTPHNLIADYFHEQENLSFAKQSPSTTAVKYVLHQLGIEIEGINKEE